MAKNFLKGSVLNYCFKYIKLFLNPVNLNEKIDQVDILSKCPDFNS